MKEFIPRKQLLDFEDPTAINNVVRPEIALWFNEKFSSEWELYSNNFLANVFSISLERVNELKNQIKSAAGIVRIAVHPESNSEGTFTEDYDGLKQAQLVLRTGYMRHVNSTAKAPLITFINPEEQNDIANQSEFVINTNPSTGGIPSDFICDVVIKSELPVDLFSNNTERFLMLLLKSLGAEKIIVLGQFLRDGKRTIGGCTSNIIRAAKLLGTKVTLSRYVIDDNGKQVTGNNLNE